MRSIEAVIENFNFEGVEPWIISTEEKSYIRLFAGITDEEIGKVMLSACTLSSGEIIRETAFETLKKFVSNEGFVLEGGLLFKENDEIKAAPGCCCGLEDWLEWLSVPIGQCDIWTGHDPSSYIQINDRKIKIWHDEKNKVENQSIEFTIDEMFKRLINIEKDLKDFLFRLSQWTKFIAPELENQVVEHFAKNINIK